MKPTDLTLLEQMRISEFEIEQRKALLGFTEADAALLASSKPIIEQHLDGVVAEFYRIQTNVPENAVLIGDAGTLQRLQAAQRNYIFELFDGDYGLHYVGGRLRIGMVHKRIGVQPKLYLAAVNALKQMLSDVLATIYEAAELRSRVAALDKLLWFDVTLVFEAYVKNLLNEVEIAKDKAERYAASLEEKVRERTQQLEELMHTDPLTGVWNIRCLYETLSQILLTARRRQEPVTLIYIDIDDFKQINDTYGHQQGDEVLRSVGQAMKSVLRTEDCCYRYGGDEFCVILVNCLESQAHEVFVKRLHEEIRKSLDDVSLSIGIVQTGPSEYLSCHDLIGIADKHMYAVKKASKLQRKGAN